MSNAKRVPIKPEEVRIGDWVKVQGYAALGDKWAWFPGGGEFRIMEVGIESAEREVAEEPKPGEWRCVNHPWNSYQHAPCCMRACRVQEVYRAAQGDKPAGYSQDERKGERRKS